MPNQDEQLITLTERQRVHGGWGEYRTRNVTWAEAKAVKRRWLDARKRYASDIPQPHSDIRPAYKVGEWAYIHVIGTLSELNSFDDYVLWGNPTHGSDKVARA